MMNNLVGISMVEMRTQVALELLSHRPLNTRRVAHSMHRTYQPVSGLLGKIPIHLTLFGMNTKKIHHIWVFYNIWIHQFTWMDIWNKMILAIVTQGRYSFLDD